MTASGSVYAGRPATSWEEVQAAGGVRRSGRDKQRGSLLDAFGEAPTLWRARPASRLRWAASTSARLPSGSCARRSASSTTTWSTCARSGRTRGASSFSAATPSWRHRSSRPTPARGARGADSRGGEAARQQVRLRARRDADRPRCADAPQAPPRLRDRRELRFWLRQGLVPPAYCSPAVRHAENRRPGGRATLLRQLALDGHAPSPRRRARGRARSSASGAAPPPPRLLPPVAAEEEARWRGS